MRAVTHIYGIRKLPLEKIEYIHKMLGKIIQERFENPKNDMDKHYVQRKKLLETLDG